MEQATGEGWGAAPSTRAGTQGGGAGAGACPESRGGVVERESAHLWRKLLMQLDTLSTARVT